MYCIGCKGTVIWRRENKTVTAAADAGAFKVFAIQTGASG
jgi:hypothetical protein